jgi:pimeloyl-ACP methyl ester carboxylesterase
MKRVLTIPIVLCILSGCSFPGVENPQTAESPAPDLPGRPASQSAPDKRCGDGVCNGPETATNCPQDCSDEAGLSAQENVLWVENPSNGSKLAVSILTPANWDGVPLPTLILIPGGIGDSSDFMGGSRSAQSMAERGFTIVIFDPEGRGASGGEEDLNGFVGQDGLAEIVRTAAAQPEVDPDRIGLVSYSFGVTLASGTLARYPDLPVVFFIDWEGPANRIYTTHDCSPDAPGIGSTSYMASCEDDEFWREREAETFIASVRVPYQRIQFEDDHSQDSPEHAVVMVNAAVNGDPPWVRLNDDPPNTIYALSPLPPMFPGSAGSRLNGLVADFAQELFALFAP